MKRNTGTRVTEAEAGLVTGMLLAGHTISGITRRTGISRATVRLINEGRCHRRGDIVYPIIHTHHPATEEQVLTIISLLKNPGISMSRIAADAGVSIATVEKINCGRHSLGPDEGESYPIRPKGRPVCAVGSEPYLAIYSKRARPVIDYVRSHPGATLTEVAGVFGMSLQKAGNIIAGRSYTAGIPEAFNTDGEPLIVSRYAGKETRKKYRERIYREQHIYEIVRDLRETSLTMRAIAGKYGISQPAVSRINRGEAYAIPGTDYPVRHARCSEEAVPEIIAMLREGIPQSHIAGRMGISQETVRRINDGTKWPQPGITYPVSPVRRGRHWPKK